MTKKNRLLFTLTICIITIVMAGIMIKLEGKRGGAIKVNLHNKPILKKKAPSHSKDLPKDMKRKDNLVVPQEKKPSEKYKEIMPGVRLFLQNKKIELDGVIVSTNRPLEFVVCTGDLKAHETIIMTDIKPSLIHTLLLAIGATPNGGLSKLGSASRPKGDRLIIEISWLNKNGKTLSYPAEDLIYYDIKNKLTIPRVGWIFSGSIFENEIDPDTGENSGRELYLADPNGTMIATYHDPLSTINTPLSIGQSDEIFFPNRALLPPPGTKAIVTIRIPADKDNIQMQITEDKFEKDLKEHNNE